MCGGERESIEAGSHDYPASATSYAGHAQPTVISLTMPGDESGKFRDGIAGVWPIGKSSGHEAARERCDRVVAASRVGVESRAAN